MCVHREEAAERKQSGRLLECVEDDFLTQLLREPAEEGTLPGLCYVYRAGLGGELLFGVSFGYSDWFSIRRK